MKRWARITVFVLGLGILGISGSRALGQSETPAKAADAAKEMKKEPGKAADKAGINRKALMDPNSAEMNVQAPDVFRAKLETSKGDIVIEVTRDLSPRGADRFYNLVRNGFYDEVRFFRVVANFMAQFGMNGDPAIAAAWQKAPIKDDPVKASNTRGMVSYAMAGPNTRTTQLFINYKNNSALDPQGFSPFGKVVTGMDVVDALYSGYGEGAPRGKGPSQALITSDGNAYLAKDFPKLDYIVHGSIVEDSDKAKKN
jgi:peptidyl-prolyl cis-trans isomerase A (cyclophilin A)